MDGIKKDRQKTNLESHTFKTVLYDPESYLHPRISANI